MGITDVPSQEEMSPGNSDINSQIQQVLEGLQTQQTVAEVDYIGNVPPQYFNQGGPFGPDPRGAGQLGPAQEMSRFKAGVGQRNPYIEGEESALLANMRPEQIRMLQDRLAFTGFLDPGDYQPGLVRGTTRTNSNTVSAMYKLLDMSNFYGESYDNLLGRMEQGINSGDLTREQVAGSGDESEEQRPTFSTPDMASLRNRVKAQFRQYLKREPTTAEVARFAEEMVSDYRGMAGDRQAQFEDPSQFDQNVGAGRVASVREEVDPEARFIERMETMYTGQRNVVEDSEESREAMGNAANVVGRPTGPISRGI